MKRALPLVLWSLLVFSTSPAFALSPEDSLALRRALSAFDHEPDIYAVQEAALDHRELTGDSLDRYSRRARRSSLIPQLQAQASWLDQRDVRHRFRENIRADDDGFYAPNTANHHLDDDFRFRGLYSIRLTFDLSRLVFHPQELPIQREVSRQWTARELLLQEITELYFARRRHQVLLLLNLAESMEDTLDRLLAIDALTARIDALTGGWFRAALEDLEDSP